MGFASPGNIIKSVKKNYPGRKQDIDFLNLLNKDFKSSMCSMRSFQQKSFPVLIQIQT